MVQSWDELESELAKLDKEDNDLLRGHFNECVEGEDDLGDILFGNREDFITRIDLLDEEPYEEFAAALEKEELIIIDN